MKMKITKQKEIEHLITVMQEAGYNPYDQLYAYLETGLDTYITRKGNARTLVAEIDRDQLWAYIAPHIKQKSK